MKRSKIINIISGKGGCGKSLLTAVLGRALAKEGSDVLLVDLDIFVRGLTVLIDSTSQKKKGTGKITVSELLGLTEIESENYEPVKVSNFDQLRIDRFLECDVLPSTQHISSPLDYDDRDLSLSLIHI